MCQLQIKNVRTDRNLDQASDGTHYAMWFPDNFSDSECASLLFAFGSAIACPYDHRLIGVEIADLPQDAEHLLVGNSQIQHYHIRACGAKEFEACPPTLSERDVLAIQTEERVEEMTARYIIRNDQDLRHGDPSKCNQDGC